MNPLCLMFILGICAAGSLAQQSDPNRPSAILIRLKEIDETERERNLRGIQQVPQVTNKDMERLRASLMKRRGDDFRSLQIVDNEMTREAAESKALNCEHIIRQAAQIKARANSLKMNLALPGATSTSSKRDQSDNVSDQDLRAQLDGIDGSIRSFVTNPIFREFKVFDLNLSTQAILDLKKIIEVSENVRKNANRLARLHKPER